MRRTCTKQTWWCPLQAITSSELPGACNPLPRLSEQSYPQSNRVCVNDPFPRAIISSIHPSSQVFFLLSYSKEETAGNRKLSKWIATADTAALLSPRRNVQSTSLACQQLETQKWRPWKLLGETSKGLWKDEGGWEGRVPSASHSCCSSQILQYFCAEECKNQTQNTQEETTHGAGLHGHN